MAGIEKNKPYKSFSEEQAEKNIYERLNTPGVFGEKITDVVDPSSGTYGNIDMFLKNIGARASGQDFPELQEHFDFNKKLGKRGDKITNEEYNVLGGMNVADVTKNTKIGDSITLTALGAAYSIVDSADNKNQDFFDLKGGIGDFGRNTLGILIKNDNPLAKFFASEKKIDKYKNLYEEMKNEIYKDKK
tara:strand:+ start:72 stop:638 length:567 start_codon:yes stop_codon:yes gene_type:complete